MRVHSKSLESSPFRLVGPLPNYNGLSAVDSLKRGLWAGQHVVEARSRWPGNGLSRCPVEWILLPAAVTDVPGGSFGDGWSSCQRNPGEPLLAL